MDGCVIMKVVDENNLIPPDQCEGAVGGEKMTNLSFSLD
jgi:hypothetical protein